jgi:hypothetical protein
MMMRRRFQRAAWRSAKCSMASVLPEPVGAVSVNNPGAASAARSVSVHRLSRAARTATSARLSSRYVTHVALKRSKRATVIELGSGITVVFALFVTIEMRLGIEKIRVRQTRKQQPHVEHGRDIVQGSGSRSARGRKREFISLEAGFQAIQVVIAQCQPELLVVFEQGFQRVQITVL